MSAAVKLSVISQHQHSMRGGAENSGNHKICMKDPLNVPIARIRCKICALLSALCPPAAHPDAAFDLAGFGATGLLPPPPRRPPLCRAAASVSSFSSRTRFPRAAWTSTWRGADVLVSCAAAAAARVSRGEAGMSRGTERQDDLEDGSDTSAFCTLSLPATCAAPPRSMRASLASMLSSLSPRGGLVDADANLGIRLGCRTSRTECSKEVHAKNFGILWRMAVPKGVQAGWVHSAQPPRSTPGASKGKAKGPRSSR